MQVRKEHNGLTVKAIKGDAMTLLAFDLAANRRKNFAGFTIYYTIKGKKGGNYVNNRIVFPDKFLENNPDIPEKGRNATLYAPLQKMNWVHVPSTGIDDGKVVFGNYTYQVTPRYIQRGKLLPLDKTLTASLTINVSPYNINNVQLAFARGFISSVAYRQRFGLENKKVRPAKKNDALLFDITAVAGTANRWNNKTRQMEPVDYTYEEQHEWLGWQARRAILGFLDEVIKSKTATLSVFAYDLNEPEVCRRLLQLAREKRLRIIVDDSGKHGSDDSMETAFVKKFKAAGGGAANIERGKFGALAHSKVFIRFDKGVATRVLTGSTNFSTNGLYVNANHVLIFNSRKVAGLYSRVFDASFGKEKMRQFKDSEFASTDFSFDDPDMTITFAPHREPDAQRIFDRIAGRIKTAGSDLLFAIMSDTSNGLILDAVKEQVQSGAVFTYGVTDTIGKSNKDYTVHLYKPDTTNPEGIRVAAKGIRNILQPPLGEVPGISGYAIHHKFIVVDFKGSNPVVYCGSSNLAFGPEQKNGDNLLEIRDPDIVSAFAIEALRLVNHYHFRNFTGDSGKTQNLDDLSGAKKYWLTKWFQKGNLYCRQRELYIK